MPCSRAACDERGEVLLGAELGVDRVVAARSSPIAYGLPGSSGPAVSVLLRPLRLVRPIGWIGGR